MLTYADVCNRPVDWDDALAIGTSLIMVRPDAALFDFFLRESSTSESFDGSDRGLLHALHEGTQFTCFTGLNGRALLFKSTNTEAEGLADAPYEILLP